MASGSITAGGGDTVSVSATDRVSIDCRPGARAKVYAVSGVEGSAAQRQLANISGGRQVIGPFGAAGSISIGAIGGTVDYQTGDEASLQAGLTLGLAGATFLTAAQIASPTAEMLADTTATYVSAGGAIYTSNGTNLVGLSANWFTPVVDITRNSANDATDTTLTTLATFVIPPNTIRIGSQIEIIASGEHTNSANTKQYSFRVNGVTKVGPVTATTTQSFGFRQLFHVQDANTLVIQVGAGSGNSVGSLNALNPTSAIANIINVGVTLSLECNWSAQPIAGEFIRLKFGKIVITP